MPEVPIVDAHVHLWSPERFRMTWLDGDSMLERPFGLAEYRSAHAGLDVHAMVYVQVDVAPAYALLEAEWAAARAAEDAGLQAIVAFAPLEDGDCARSFLEALCKISPLITGVRRLIQSEPDPDFCLRPGFVQGVRLLADMDLSFDICIRHHQLPAATELARRCPDTRFVLDHIGKPAIAGGDPTSWRDGIHALAALPNVSCKLSGMVTEADAQHWTIDDLRPYAAHVLAAFGEDRVMFGGDWPVVLHASSFRRWVETVDALLADMAISSAAQAKIWADNARRFYRLAPPA